MPPAFPIPVDLPPSASAILDYLHPFASEANRTGMARFGICVDRALGIPLPHLRALASRFRRQHGLALDLWETEVHELRILAGLVDDPRQVTIAQMETWVRAFDSWDVCDGTCCNLFRRTPFAEDRAFAWSRHDSLYVKRAGFVLMATLGVHRRGAETDLFLRFLERVRDESHDDRPLVRKAVNWALRQIGKRSMALHPHALDLANELKRSPHRAARWIGSDAARELLRPATIARIESSQARRTSP